MIGSSLGAAWANAGPLARLDTSNSVEISAFIAASLSSNSLSAARALASHRHPLRFRPTMVDEPSQQMEHPGHPGDHRDDVGKS
jgi:hypothetical protein